MNSQTVFISFLAMVTLGIAVGLALLPVLLSIVGPIATKEVEQSSVRLPANVEGKEVRLSNDNDKDISEEVKLHAES